MRKVILLTNLVFLLYSCNKPEYSNSKTFSDKDLPEEIQLTAETVELTDIYKPINLYIRDSILFTVNSGQEFFLTAYHMKNKEKIGDYLPFGNGPDEYLFLRTLQFEDSILWAFDTAKKRALQYHFSRLIYYNEQTPSKIINLKDLFDRGLVINGKLYANSVEHPDARFSVYDENGEWIRNIGEIPAIDPSISIHEKRESYVCNMSLNPDDHSIFVAYMPTDLIEIYDSEGHLKARSHGPDRFFPVREEVKDGNTLRVRSIPNKTRDGYFAPVTFEDEIWSIYSGKYFDPQANHSFLNNRIIVFDWKGNPVRQYITDIPFFALAVDRTEQYIYAIAINPEFSIIRFNYGSVGEGG
ncbi:MAG: TolB-like 6-bladed beta-propeller domain-containing protein [Tannerella sp.]|jgi:hypothetical protein|nr:TolB-like 6-bladed beta-propeller domain-containing protein [Tannerella sp.]